MPEASLAIVFASLENRLPQQEVITSALRPRKYCNCRAKESASSGSRAIRSAYLMRTSG